MVEKIGKRIVSCMACQQYIQAHGCHHRSTQRCATTHGAICLLQQNGLDCYQKENPGPYASIWNATFARRSENDDVVWLLLGTIMSANMKRSLLHMPHTYIPSTTRNTTHSNSAASSSQRPNIDDYSGSAHMIGRLPTATRNWRKRI